MNTYQEQVNRIANAAARFNQHKSISNADFYKETILVARYSSPEINENLDKVLNNIQEIFPNNTIITDINNQLKEGHDQFKKEQQIEKRLAKVKQLEIKADQKALKKQGVASNKVAKAVIQDLLRDKRVAKQSRFEEKGKKTSGVSDGYVATEKKDPISVKQFLKNPSVLKQIIKDWKKPKPKNTFILKQFYKNPKQCETQQDYMNRRDGVNELIAAEMYQILLADRAPKEALVKPDKNNKKSIYVRSKFFTEVQPLSEFTGKKDSHFNAKSTNLQKLDGLEKVIAACHMIGEIDYHAGNLMVQNQKNEKGDDKFVVTKIDHGRSLIGFHKDFGSMISSTINDFRAFHYDKAINSGNLKFSASKYSESLQQMIEQFGKEQIDNIVDKKIDQLKKIGFNPKNIQTAYSFDRGSPKNIFYGMAFNSFEDIAQSYKSLLTRNVENMKRVAKDMDIVSKFSNVTPQFKDGGWVQTMASSYFKDPILFAAQNNIKIEGKNALQWAMENKKNIETVNTFQVQEQKENRQYVKGKDRKWHAETKLQTEKRLSELVQQIDDPSEYILYNKNRTNLSLSKDVLKFLDNALDKNMENIKGEKYTNLIKRYNMTHEEIKQSLGQIRGHDNPQLKQQNNQMQFHSMQQHRSDLSEQQTQQKANIKQGTNQSKNSLQPKKINSQKQIASDEAIAKKLAKEQGGHTQEQILRQIQNEALKIREKLAKANKINISNRSRANAKSHKQGKGFSR